MKIFDFVRMYRGMLLLFVISLALAGYILFEKINSILKPARGLFSESTIIDKSQVEDGLLLFSPFIAKGNFSGNGRVYLTNLYGRIIYQWDTKYNTFYSFVTPEGNLYTAQITPSNLMDAPGGGKTGLLQEQDVKGNILWEFKDEMLHHDFDVDLNTDTVYALKFTMLSKEFSNKIIGGKPSLDEASWSDTIIQIDHSGKIIWSWNLGDHLDPRDYVLDSITPRKEWSHSNSIKFYTTNPINHKPSLLLSSRHLNTVFLIDRETGKILWSSPKGTFSYQHDATLTKDGTVLVFDNGLTREQERPFLWSRLVEINPLTNKIVWQFRGGSTGPEMGAFAASIMSGAQRLPNGNTLGIDALSGHIFEVTKDGVVVFSFINPYQALDSTGPFGNNVIFKARKISNDYFTKKFLR